MIAFEAAGWLWMIPPLIIAWWLFVRVQRRALDWLEIHVAPRFRGRFSVYGRPSLGLHMGLLLVMALALAGAAAGPFAAGKTEAASATGRVLFLLDASASMYASDVDPVTGPTGPTESAGPTESSGSSKAASLRRIDVAREIATSLMPELEGYRFALGSFSGTGAIHLPMTPNRPLIEEALRTLEPHSYYSTTGSSLSRALDLVPHFVDRRGYRLQVVLLSDGEQPTPEDYRAALAALAEQDVPVHTVAIGSLEGQGRRIFSFQDIVEKEENPRILVEYTTRRVDEHLERISARTGGSFFVAEPGVVDRLAVEILEAGDDPEPFEHDAAKSDLSGRFLLLFLAGFLIDTLWFGRKPRRSETEFDLTRLGEPRPVPLSKRRARAASLRTGSGVVLGLGGWIALGLVTACALPLGEERGGPRGQAHRENERGIDRDALGRHQAARVHYERSQAYGVEPQVPAHNLARSVLLAGDYSEAHELFQEALLLAPDLPEAHFNDAMTLFGWGQAERDPRNCDLERTLELWIQAERRFSSAVAAAAKSDPRDDQRVGSRGRDNRRALAQEMEDLERLIADPPDECLGSGGAGGGGGSGGGEDESGGGSSGASGSSASNFSEPAAEGSEPEQEEHGDDPRPADPDPKDPQDQDAGAGGGGSNGQGELSEAELDEVGRQLERLAEQSREAGKYHRRTLPEQFRKDDWANPDATIWW